MAIRKVGDDEGVVKRVTCKHCGSILEYLPIDVQEKTTTDYPGTSDTDRYITCPQCNKNVYVK